MNQHRQYYTCRKATIKLMTFNLSTARSEGRRRFPLIVHTEKSK